MPENDCFSVRIAKVGLGGIFQGKEAKSIGEKEKVIDELYRQIGQLKVENEWL